MDSLLLEVATLHQRLAYTINKVLGASRKERLFYLLFFWIKCLSAHGKPSAILARLPRGHRACCLALCGRFEELFRLGEVRRKVEKRREGIDDLRDRTSHRYRSEVSPHDCSLGKRSHEWQQHRLIALLCPHSFE